MIGLTPETNHQIQNYSTFLGEFILTSKNLWQSKKAQTEGLFTLGCGLLPDKIIISREVISADDQASLAQALRRSIARGFFPGVRTCFKPQINDSPWIMDIKTEEDIQNFLENEYQDWLKLPNITELIVMDNMPDLGKPEKYDEFFVFKMGERSEVKEFQTYIELRLGTYQLRGLEADTSPDDIIVIKLDNFESFVLTIGANYSPHGSSVEYDFFGKDLDQVKSDLMPVVDEGVLTTIVSFLKHFQGMFSDSQLAIKRKLKAFGEVGLEHTEWQGRIDDEGDVMWTKIYGFKGSNDDTNWSQVRKITSRSLAQKRLLHPN